MRGANPKLSVLEERHALRLLLSLYNNGRSQRSSLYSAISKTTTAPMKRVNELISLGLVTETVMESAPFAKNVELTEEGRKVAKRIAEIDEILSEMK